MVECVDTSSILNAGGWLRLLSTPVTQTFSEFVSSLLFGDDRPESQEAGSDGFLEQTEIGCDSRLSVSSGSSVSASSFFGLPKV